jgi:hypothetical protein
MRALKHRLLSLALAIALPLAPLLHAASHLHGAACLAYQSPVSRALAAWAMLHPCKSTCAHLHAQACVCDHCETCQSLAQAKDLAPVFQALALEPLEPSFSVALAEAAPRSSLFLSFDHRGPPVQA